MVQRAQGMPCTGARRARLARDLRLLRSLAVKCEGLYGLLSLPMARRILGQRQMCAEPVVMGSMDSAQMGVAQDDDVTEAFPADRADQSLRMPVPSRA